MKEEYPEYGDTAEAIVDYLYDKFDGKAPLVVALGILELVKLQLVKDHE